ncbi:molecular chaperone DnaJ [Candidatus Micrarchaeota archaeon]|nr:molecular chaperone DnaJ [Candidatus Micrarchaeota archaeon]
MNLAAKSDYYEILGISKNASSEEIKSAYKRLAKKYHPDVSADPKAKEKFQEALEAYNVLSDSQKRQNYDQFGHATEGFSGYQGFRDFSGFGGGGIDFDFSDLFENFSGFEGFSSFTDLFGGRKKRDQHGENLRVDISIPFKEAIFGVTKTIEIERIENCSDCYGSGAEKGDSGKKTCSRCNGKGLLQKTQQTPFGLFSTQTTCAQCGGEGKIIEKPCNHCRGKGKIRKNRKIKVKIPAGIETGMHLHLQGEGNTGIGKGSQGDLFVVVFVEKHKFFKRDGPDIFFETPLSFSEVALGTKLEVPTLKGKAMLDIPSGTQTDTIFRMKGKGVKDLNSGRQGDQFVKVKVLTPSKLSRKERKLFEELNEQNGMKAKRKSVFDFLK